MKRKFGGRHNSCPNSLVYRTYAKRLAAKIVERYKGYDNIVLWHISNEYGGECYCENCEKAFRVWLKAKYKTLSELNRVWNTSFWGHTFYEWDEIVLPNLLSEHFEYDRSMFQGITLDYKRFNSDSILECYKLEYDEIKRISAEVPITTNLMGFYKGLDYQKWAQHMDVVSWDNYPANEDSPAQIAMAHDLMRGVGGGKPFLLMEQTPSVTNWLPYNALKRPQVMRLWSYQAVAHGSDSVMFFQMRRTVGACEKLHGAVIDHVGTNKTRVYREVARLGEELDILGGAILGARTTAKVAIYFDWEIWWSVECSAGPSCELKYKDEIFNYYEAFHKMHIPVDLVGPEDDLGKYRVLVAPILYMTKPGYDENIRHFVKNGGTFITTFFSGVADEHDLILTGGYPGKLRDILGIWVEEEDALPSGTENKFIYKKEEYPARLLCDLLHLETAESLGAYTTDFYAGMPAITRNDFGTGRAYYVATRSNPDFYAGFLKTICDEAMVEPLVKAHGELEVTERVNENGSFLFLLNHAVVEHRVCLPKSGTDMLTGRLYESEEEVVLEAKGVAIIHMG